MRNRSMQAPRLAVKTLEGPPGVPASELVPGLWGPKAVLLMTPRHPADPKLFNAIADKLCSTSHPNLLQALGVRSGQDGTGLGMVFFFCLFCFVEVVASFVCPHLQSRSYFLPLFFCGLFCLLSLFLSFWKVLVLYLSSSPLTRLCVPIVYCRIVLILFLIYCFIDCLCTK